MTATFPKDGLTKRLKMKSNIVVALAAFWVNFCLLGVLRSNAVIYKALVDVFGVNREVAAWPSGIFGFCMCVTGALSGFLTYHISLRNLAMFGVLLASTAVSMSSFASNINQIVCLYGALQGIGVGLIVPLTHVVLNQHFTKYRALALGIAYSGSSAGSFLFPPVSHLLLSEYDLNGTFLLLGSIMLNAVVGAMFFKSPKPQEKVKKKINLLSDDTKFPQEECSITNNINALKNAVFVSENHKEDISQAKTNVYNVKTSSITPVETTKSKKDVKRNFFSKFIPSFKIAADILLSPHFFIVSAAYAVYFSTSAIFLMVALDFAQDRGVPLEQGVYLVSAFSIGDCAGRLSFGWIADTQFVRRNVLVRVYLLAMGVLTGLLPFCPVQSFLAVSVLLGILNGSVIVNHSVLLNEYLGLEKLPLAIGFSMFFIGLTAMLRPLIIGFFRDQNESYDLLFTFIGFLQVLITALWFLGSFVQSLRKRSLVDKIAQ